MQKKEHVTPEGTVTFGLALFFVSLSVLFIASAVGVLVVRLKSPVTLVHVTFPPIGWVSTGALAVVSLAMHFGVRAVRRDRKRPLQVWMLIALGASLAFVALQGFFFWELIQQEVLLANSVESSLYAFLMLTALHAAHVIGGILMQAVVTVRTLGNRYWSLHHAQVRGTAMYWHFIDVIWVALVAFLFAIR